MDATVLAGRCPRCGARLPADAPEGLCAPCVLIAATASLTHVTNSESPTVLSPLSASAGPMSDGPQLEDGQRFGPYRIGRVLGRGGMGEVYEAEHVDTGRRLALKVLRGRLSTHDDRARFLHEGQLAASVSHPHTVYIFGSEEIAGMPVIAMELLPGGTLRDRVMAEGPLSPAHAVSAVLDIVGGLDAAQAAGILHRDIKPSNCFTDIDGGVKVGDFGLSISTLARDVQSAAWTQGFQGTPQFAAPEQLRGEPLDVRADIYAVGATLFYLLTGQAPFDARELRELVARVTNEPPRSPRTLQPRVPAALAAVVLQCLAKQPRDRPATYAALADALRPFAASAATPAPLGLRTMAGIVDALVISLPFSLSQAVTLHVSESGRFQTTVATPWPVLCGVVYYLILEGVWGASLGKRLFRLRVTGPLGTPSWRQVGVRTAVFCGVASPAIIALALFGAETLTRYLDTHVLVGVALSLSNIWLTALLFSTIRRGNGWTAIHDRASRTRVVVRAEGSTRRAGAGTSSAAPIDVMPMGARSHCGPFDVVADLGETPGGRLLEGFDPVLRRRVWIRAVPHGTPPVTDVRRDIGRVGRLHWLAGRRTIDENWDAFEAPEGRPLRAAVAGDVGWRVAKAWLMDVASELEVSTREGSLPALDLDRIWIRADGCAVLLDFPAPGAPSSAQDRLRRRESASALTPVALLALMGREILPAEGRIETATTVPMSARDLLRRWMTMPTIDIGRAREELAVVSMALDRVPRLRRAVPIVLGALPILMVLAGGIAAIPLFFASTTPEMFEMFSLASLVQQADAGRSPFRDADHRRYVETYLAGRYGRVIRNDRTWSLLQSNLSRLRGAAEHAVAAHPSVTPAELAEATQALAPDLARTRDNYDRTAAPVLRGGPVVMIAALVGLAGAFACLVAITSNLFAPGGVSFRLLGLAVVDGRGRPIGRARALVRILIIWLPVFAGAIWLLRYAPAALVGGQGAPVAVLVAVLGTLSAGALWSLAEPSRGPHDRLVGTRIVPR